MCDPCVLHAVLCCAVLCPAAVVAGGASRRKLVSCQLLHAPVGPFADPLRVVLLTQFKLLLACSDVCLIVIACECMDSFCTDSLSSSSAHQQHSHARLMYGWVVPSASPVTYERGVGCCCAACCVSGTSST
jgi:hypothetical protein